MAKTYGYALVGALIATFTVSPVLAQFLFPDKLVEKETLLVRWLKTAYLRVLAWALNYREWSAAVGAVFLVATFLLVPSLGTEFLPKLEEGNLWIRATLPPTVSLEAGEPYVQTMREMIRSFPEVITVVSQHGRPDDGTDPTGFFNVEFFAPLKPFDQWPKGETKEKLIESMKSELQETFPGVNFNFSQTIEDNVEEAVSGVKGENSVKLFGNELDRLEDFGYQIQRAISSVPGIQEAGLFKELGQPNLLVDIDRERSARYGLAAGDVNAMVQAAIGGQSATDVFEQERHFPLVVRLMPQYRDSVEGIKNIPIETAARAMIPLRDLADVKIASGASYIYRENNHRYIPIKFSVRGRDLGSTVAEAQTNVQRDVKLPSGYEAEWSGEFGELKEAEARLAYIVPLSLLLIVILLYSTFNSVRDTALVILSIPFAVTGGIWALFLTHINFSVSAAVGFISLFGVAVMEGIILISYYNQLQDKKTPEEDALMRAASVRMRPVLMTCMSACIGLLPAAVSTGIGSQTQRPLATVIVGGMLLTPVLILLFVPVLLAFLPQKSAAKRRETDELHYGDASV